MHVSSLARAGGRGLALTLATHAILDATGIGDRRDERGLAITNSKADTDRQAGVPTYLRQLLGHGRKVQRLRPGHPLQ